MDGQRQRSGGGRRRRRRAKAESKEQRVPVLIAARRPDSPLLAKVSNRAIAASAQPKKNKPDRHRDAGKPQSDGVKLVEDKPRRVARIAQAPTVVLDEKEARRQALLERLVSCEGRSAISRVANDLLAEGGIPAEQEYQLQLLEHVDESRVADAIEVLSRLLEEQAPIKRPILDRRLRRLEDEADERMVRDKAGELRRFIRTEYPLKPAVAS